MDETRKPPRTIARLRHASPIDGLAATANLSAVRRGLRTIRGTVVEHTAPRFEQLLRPTDAGIPGRYFDPGRYAAARRLDGQSVLLIDDTWVTGSSAQSAAAALREAGAVHVACVVIGRWLRPDYGGDWGNVGDIYNRLTRQFDWARCAAENTTQDHEPHARPGWVVVGRGRESRARRGARRQALPCGSPPASPDGPGR